MANVLISTLPAAGHVGPALTLAARLIERGHCVCWLTGPEYATMVKVTGARFVPMAYRQPSADRPGGFQVGLGAINATLKAELVTPMFDLLREYRAILEDFPADVVLVDTCSLGAVLLSDLGGPPFATLGIIPFTLPSPEAPPFNSGLPPATTAVGRLRNRLLNWLFRQVLLRDATRTYNRGRTALGLPPLPRGRCVTDLSVSPFLHLQSGTPAFDYPRSNLPPQVHFIGPLLAPAPIDFTTPSWWGELDGSRPVVHLTQGTYTTEPGKLLIPALRGLAGQDLLVVATTPEPAALGPLPSNARVERFIPHARLLPRVDVMVTNGGYGGVQAALAHGVPLVGGGRTEDKPEVCARIAWTGVGINLETDRPSPQQVAGAVLRVLCDPSYRRNAERIQADFAQHDTPNEAAELLERLVTTRSPVIRAPAIASR